MTQLLQTVMVQFLCCCNVLFTIAVATRNNFQGLVTLTSSVDEEGRKGACLGEQITLTCSIQNTAILIWSWGNLSVSNRAIITELDELPTEKNGFTANLTSVHYNDDGTTNFESTLTFNALDYLNGTTVNCYCDSSNYSASYQVYILYTSAPPPPSTIHHELIGVHSNYSVYIIEWAAVPEAESYEVNVTRADMNRQEITSINISSFTISSIDTDVNFSIRASNCMGYGDAYMSFSQFETNFTFGTEMSPIPYGVLEAILGTLCGVFGGVLGTVTVLFIVIKLKNKIKGLEVKKHRNEYQESQFSPIPSKKDDTEYSEVRDSSGNWHTCRRQKTATGKSSKDTDTYSRPRDYISWIQLHTTASAPHGQPNYEEINCMGEPQTNFRLISSTSEVEEIPVHQVTQSGVSDNTCMNNAFKPDQATTYEENPNKQELKMSHRQLSSRYEMHELPDFRILEQSSEPQAVGGGYTEEQKRRLEYSDLSRNSMYFSLQPCVQKKPPTVPPEPTSESRYSSLHHEYID